MILAIYLTNIDRMINTIEQLQQLQSSPENDFPEERLRQRAN
jgi:hypothetical protein